MPKSTVDTITGAVKGAGWIASLIPDTPVEGSDGGSCRCKPEICWSRAVEGLRMKSLVTG